MVTASTSADVVDPSSDVANLATQRLFGLDFVSESSLSTVADVILADAERDTNQWRCVVTPNVDHLVRYERFEDEAEVAGRSRIVLPDGMPIVWASRLLGRPLRSRLTGSDLFEVLWPELVRRKIATVVVAPLQIAADRLALEHSNLRCIVPALFETSDEETVEEIVEQVAVAVDEVDARVVIISVSMPKHHLLAARLEHRWSSRTMATPVVLLLGASPMFYLGLTKRAPRWMQRVGLEWLHRLASDPRRMAKRYLVQDTRFVFLVWQNWRRRYDPSERASAAATDRVRILNATFDALTLEETVDSVFSAVDRGKSGWMCTVNSAVLMMMRSRPDLQSYVDRAGWVIADGQSVVWLARLLRRPLSRRVAGIDLIDPICARAQADGRGVFLLGATQETIAELLEQFRERYPTLSIAGSDGYFAGEQSHERADEIRRTDASIVFVGMGVPRQEQFIRDQFERMGVGVAIGVGGSFDVLVGKRRRAPRWMQVAGLEWTFRLVQEPRRLFGRYLTTGTHFLALSVRALFVPRYRDR